MIVGQPTTLTFSLVAPEGVTYSSPAVTVETMPWSTAGALQDHGDGTYSITITPDKEAARTVRLKVIQDGVTRYHGILTTASIDNLVLSSIAATSVATGGSADVLYNISDSVGVKVWDLSASSLIIDKSTVACTPDRAGITVTALSNAHSGVLLNRGILHCNQAWTTADQGTLVWSFDILHPLSGIRHTFKYLQDITKAPVGAWVSTGSIRAGMPTTLQFSLKYASGNPVKGGVLRTTVVTGATVDPNIVVVDESQGLYGITVTPTQGVDISVNPAVSVGNVSQNWAVGAKGFALLKGTSYRKVSNLQYRPIDFVLKNLDGTPMNDATIVGITNTEARHYLMEEGSGYKVPGDDGVYLARLMYDPALGGMNADIKMGLRVTQNGDTFDIITFLHQGYNVIESEVVGEAHGTVGSVITFHIKTGPLDNWSYYAPMIRKVGSAAAIAGQGSIVKNGSTFTWTVGEAIPAGVYYLEGAIITSPFQSTWYADDVTIL